MPSPYHVLFDMILDLHLDLFYHCSAVSLLRFNILYPTFTIRHFVFSCAFQRCSSLLRSTSAVDESEKGLGFIIPSRPQGMKSV